ncbi:MAG: hypothetical protein ACTSV2_04385, partial [Candidatus Thorarchaeota archaeon]
PNFEVPDLVYDDGTSASSKAKPETSGPGDVAAAASTETEEFSFAPVGKLPTISVSIKGIWEKAMEAHGTLLCEMAIYGASLPEGHLEAMFEKSANAMLRRWIHPGDPLNLITKFGEFMFSCSNESQVPRTGTDNTTLEVSPCKILQVARRVDPDGSLLPPGYPCAYHELIAKKVSEISDLNIIVNTSSTGCTVDMRFKS